MQTSVFFFTTAAGVCCPTCFQPRLSICLSKTFCFWFSTLGFLFELDSLFCLRPALGLRLRIMASWLLWFWRTPRFHFLPVKFRKHSVVFPFPRRLEFGRSLWLFDLLNAISSFTSFFRSGTPLPGALGGPFSTLGVVGDLTTGQAAHRFGGMYVAYGSETS